MNRIEVKLGYLDHNMEGPNSELLVDGVRLELTAVVDFDVVG